MTDNGPVEVIRDGSIKAAIFRNHGENGSFFSTQITRTYEDREGNIRDAHSFTGTDLLRASEIAKRAYERTIELRRDNSRSEHAPRNQRQAQFEMNRKADRNAPRQSREPAR